ncbi:MAG: magnesium chelatase [Dehalococcoidia bacterium]
MPRASRPRTLGALKETGYRPVSIREEVHRNLMRKIAAGEELFPGIIGYRDTVVPEVENALLAGQSVIILGERGQAKSRLVRSMTALLDEEIPIIAGSETNDDPCTPVSAYGRQKLAAEDDDLAIDWIPREARYGEKLATPDVSMADLIGDVDPIKVAEGRYLGDELTMHYGLLPRTNRGIFCVNELPDLSERIQVGLFNLMEERDIQIRGYTIRLPLDVLIFATANPEDYTNRGRIITPLKDRFGAQVRTHYPLNTEDELSIVQQERLRFDGTEKRVVVPDYMSEVVSEISALARASPEVNQRSGVSVRVSIANFETMRSAALRRGLRHGEDISSPRITDLPAVASSMRGKIELETFEDGREDAVIEQLTKQAIANVFGRRFAPGELDRVVTSFEQGSAVQTGADIESSGYVQVRDSVAGLAPVVEKLGGSGSAAETASAVEFVLEGLHLERKLNRDQVAGGYAYRRSVQAASVEPGSRELWRRRRQRDSRED